MTTTIEICIKWHTTFYLCFQIWKKTPFLIITLAFHYRLTGKWITNFQMLNARACLNDSWFVCVYIYMFCAHHLNMLNGSFKNEMKKNIVKLWQTNNMWRVKSYMYVYEVWGHLLFFAYINSSSVCTHHI